MFVFGMKIIAYILLDLFYHLCCLELIVSPRSAYF